MTADPHRVAVIGEVMLELRPGRASGDYALGYAGDTFNTAVQLARLGVQTSYVTMLGRDPFSDAIIERANAEGLDTQQMIRSDDAMPGLYLIRNDGQGEREFFYWRENSAARRLFKGRQRIEGVVRYLQEFRWVYLSGITLAVMGQGAAEAFWYVIESLHAAGVRLLFDPNYRARLWPDADTTRSWYRRMLAQSHWTFPTLDDEAALWGLQTPDAVLDFHRRLQVNEIALKTPSTTAVAWTQDQTAQVASSYTGPVVDTTGAGDAFNAGYIAARLQGLGLSEALNLGHVNASRVVAVQGAIP